MSITDTELAALESLCEKATSGPWYIGFAEMLEDGETLIARMVGQDVIAKSPNAASLSCESPDQNFIITARTALPILIAEVRRLRAENAELRIQRDEAMQTAEMMVMDVMLSQSCIEKRCANEQQMKDHAAFLTSQVTNLLTDPATRRIRLGAMALIHDALRYTASKAAAPQGDGHA